jgi:hypothetical protein
VSNTRDEDQDKNRAQLKRAPSGKYGYHYVDEDEGGIRIERVTEPGKESYAFFHPSGSYVEWFPNGKKVSMTIGENKEYNKGGVTITIDENHDVHIKGHSKLQVGGGSHIEVAGDAGIVVGGSVAMSMPKGDLGIQAKNIFMGATGNFNLNVEGAMKISSKGRGVVESSAVLRVGSASEVDVQAPTTNLNKSGSASGYAGPETGEA